MKAKPKKDKSQTIKNMKKSVTHPIRVKNKAKPCEAVLNEPKDDGRSGDEAAIGDNDGIHNISMLSCLSEVTLDEDSTEATEAEQPHMQDGACTSGVEPKGDTKDRLHTNNDGDIVVKNSPYTIPRKMRLEVKLQKVQGNEQNPLPMNPISLNNSRKKIVDKTPMMMMEVGKGPIADLEGVMEEVKELTEAMIPKPQSVKSTRPLKKRKITFAEPSSNTIPRDNTENQNVPEEIEHDVQADQEKHNTKVSNI